MITSHARLRAEERYGIDPTFDDYEEISRQIQDGDAEKIGKHGTATSVYKVIVRKKECFVVYHRKEKCVITFLPLDWEKREHEDGAARLYQKPHYYRGERTVRRNLSATKKAR